MAKTKTNVLIGTAVLSFKYPIGGSYIEVGYTSDGVDLEYSKDSADVEVEEESFPIAEVITKEGLTIECKMAESSLINISVAMGGAKLVGSMITVGDGINKEMSVKLVGSGPAGKTRTVEAPLCVSTGNVGMSYKKGVKTIVPVTFKVLKPCNGAAFTIIDT